MRVINLFGGPGSGKSTTAAGLFYQMKLKLINCELVTEFAKDLTWEERYSDLQNQIYVLGTQLKRLERLRNKVDYAITDSPLLLNSVYSDHMPKSYHNLLRDVWNTFDNDCFFIKREKPYLKVGRSQSEEQAQILDKKILNILDKHEIPYYTVSGNELAPSTIMSCMGLI